MSRIDPQRLGRWLRYACYAVVIVLLWQFLSRFSFVHVDEGDNSVVGISGMHSLVLENYAAGELPARGDAVVFLMQGPDGKPVRRVSRVAGVPGDRVTLGERFIEVNGESTQLPAAGAAARIEGVVPDGMLLVLNDNPFSLFPDSRRTGLIPAEVVLGRVLVEAPF